MAHNSDCTKIYADSTSGVRLTQDIHPVLGITGDLGYVVTNGTIAPMAKYKPVRHSSVAALTVAQRALTRYGFGSESTQTQPPALTLSDNEPKNNWAYLKPRGQSQSPKEWFRMLDFNGYCSNACAPFVITVGGLYYDGFSHIILYGDSMSNNARSDGKTWVADESLSLGELLESAVDVYGSGYIAFLLVNTSISTYTKNLIVTGVTFKQFVETYNKVKDFQLAEAGSGRTESGVFYPGVPILNSGYSGNNIRVVACIMTSSGCVPASGTAYNVYSSGLTLYTPYSLGFEDGCDRYLIKLASTAATMDGTQITSMAVSYVDMVTEVTVSGATFRKYKISVNAIFSTANVPYSGSTRTISGTLTLSNNMGYVFGSSPTSGSTTVSWSSAVSLAGGTSGQSKGLFTSDTENNLWLWVMKGISSSTTVTGSVTYTTPFTTALSKSATGTIPAI